MSATLQKSSLAFLFSQLKKLNNGDRIDAPFFEADKITQACLIELEKLQKKLNGAACFASEAMLSAVEAAIIVFNEKNELQLLNEAYKNLYPEQAAVLRKGVTANAIQEHLYKYEPSQQAGLTKEEFCKNRMKNFGKTETNLIVKIGRGWYTKTTRPLSSGGHVTTITEITQFKRIEEELRSNKSNLRAAIDAANQAILLLDKKGNIIVANKSVGFYALLMGLKIKLGKGVNLLSNLNEPYKTYIEAPFIRALNGEVLEFEREILTAIGKLVFFATYSPVKSADNQISGVVISFFDVTEKRKIQERSVELIRKRAKIKEERVRVAALIQGQETERKRLARDIHDGLGQMLTAIRLQIEMVDPILLGKSTEGMNLIKSNIRNTIVEARRIAHDLMPSVLEDFGLSAALKLLINQYKRSSGIEMNFIENNKAGNKMVQDHQLKIALYRIVQEAISNIIKHSGASACEISINYNIQSISLYISDNGNKFNYPLKSGKGLGILSMKERAELLNGKFFIEASADNSCHIQVVIPIKTKNGKN